MTDGVLRVRVELVDPPDGYRCVLPIGDELRDDLSFEIGWKGEHPVGKMVVRQGDGRRFVYLNWLDASGGRYGRIKLWAHQIAPPGTFGEVLVRLKGTDKKGRPACATVELA